MKILAPIRSVKHQLGDKSLRGKLHYIMSLSGSPEHLALSFAIGIFLGLCPFYGIHTFVVLLAVYLFRLNLPTMMLGACLNLPFVAPAVYLLCYEFGRLISFSSDTASEAVISDAISKILHLNFSEITLQKADAINMIRTLFIGTTAVGIMAAFLGYYSLKYAIKIHRRRVVVSNDISEN